MLDNITQLKVGNLRIGNGSRKLLSLLLYHLNHGSEWVKEEIFMNRPILLVCFAAHNGVDEATREEFILKTQLYLTSWITSTDTPVQAWGKTFVERLIKCTKNQLLHLRASYSQSQRVTLDTQFHDCSYLIPGYYEAGNPAPQ